MSWILLLAAKSFVVAGAALLLLRLAAKRSASDRSLIAHLGLSVLLVLPIAAFTLPALDVTAPAALTAAPPAATGAALPVAGDAGKETAAAATFPRPQSTAVTAPVDWAFWTYAAPASLLILVTLIALARLVLLQRRATVLVEPNWLTALARAQQRMGFKHGTALLTSDDLPSPISWGLMRPVILLSKAAAESHREAEAIIAHELAHVANLDWLKLLVSRFAVALFWFNPLVWLLAREAHQLREEAADDAVLGANIEDTDYAELLVGVARHECRGFLIGAHGVAPARNSLARRVRRVLDTATLRAPGGWRWASAAAFFAAGMAVPVAALNFVPASSEAPVDTTQPYYSSQGDDAVASASAPAASAGMASGAALAAAHPHASDAELRKLQDELERARGDLASRGPGPGRIGPDPRSLPGRGRPGARDALDLAIELKAVGVTADYAAEMRRALGHARLASDDLIELKAVGVTPEYVREITRISRRPLSTDEVVSARAIGLTPDYVRGMAAAGYGNLTVEELSELRAVGVTPAFVERFRRAGHRNLSAERLVELQVHGINPEDIAGLERDESP